MCVCKLLLPHDTYIHKSRNEMQMMMLTKQQKNGDCWTRDNKWVKRTAVGVGSRRRRRRRGIKQLNDDVDLQTNFGGKQAKLFTEKGCIVWIKKGNLKPGPTNSIFFNVYFLRLSELWRNKITRIQLFLFIILQRLGSTSKVTGFSFLSLGDTVSTWSQWLRYFLLLGW